MDNEVKIVVTADTSKVKAAQEQTKTEMGNAGAAAGAKFGSELATKADEEIKKRPPVDLPVTGANPIDDAWRAKVQASIKSIAKDAIQIPLTPETAKYREELELAVGELSSAIKQKIPVDTDGADQFKLHVEELAKEVSSEVKAKITVEPVIDETAKATTAAAAGGGGPGGLALAILGGLPIAAPAIGAATGAALLGGLGLGLAGMGAVLAARTPEVVNAANALTTDVRVKFDGLGATLAQPVTQALGTIKTGFDQLEPSIDIALVKSSGNIDKLAQAVVGFAGSAMPGLVNASGRLGPVFDGITSAGKTMGSAVGQSLDSVSQHSVSIGTGFATLGSVAGGALGLITSLTNTLADEFAKHGGQIDQTLKTVETTVSGLAAGAFPAMGQAIGGDLAVINGLLSALGPANQVLGAMGGYALSAYTNVSLLGKLSGPISSASDALKNAGTEGSLFNKVTSGAGEALGKLGNSLPYIGIGLTAVGVAMDLDSQHAQDLAKQSDALASGLEAGGTAAISAREQLAKLGVDAATSTKNMADLESTQKQGTQTAGAYGNMAGSNATKIATQSQAVSDNNKVVTDAVNKYNTYIQSLGAAGQSVDQITGKTEVFANSSQSASSNTAQLKSSMDLLAGSTATADQRIQALQQELAILGDNGLQKAQDYAAKFGSTLDSFGQQMGTAKGAVFSLNGELNTNSERGRDVLTVLEQSQQAWAGQAQAMADAGVSTNGINQALQGNQDQLRGVLRAAGLTAPQIQALIAKYGLIPKNITTNVHADTSDALGKVDGMIRYINGLRASIRVDAFGNTSALNFGGGRTASATGGVIGSHAYGGISGAATGMASSAGLTWVGEQGPELVSLPIGSTVTPNSNANSLLQRDGGQAPVINSEFRVTGDVDTALAKVIMLLIRDGKIQIRQQYVQR